MDMASLTSVMPMAALWRVPKCWRARLASGSTQPAATMRSLWPMMTAPSCRAVLGKNMVERRSCETTASIFTPFSIMSPRATLRSMTMMAPMRRAARAQAVRLTVRIISVRTLAFRLNSRRKFMLESACRMS